MVDSSKIGSTFRIWAGAGESLNPGEFKGALDKADINSDGKLSRSEFNAVASGLGLSSAEAESFFNKARGSDSEVSISGLITAAEDFNAADGKWTRDEFTTVVTSLATPDQRSAFMDIAGEDAIIDRGEMEAVVSEADTNGDSAISAEEFGKVSETLGVGSSGSAAVASAFKDIAGEASSAKFDEVLSYFTAFSDRDGSYTEAAFNSLVQNLSGGSTGSTGSGSTGGSTGSTGSGSTGGSTGSTGSGSTGGSTGSTGSGSTGGSTGSTGSGSTGGSTGSTGSGSTGSGSTGGSTGSTAAKISISKEAFEFLTGTDLLLQRDELAAVFNKVDAGQDKKLTIEEFRSAAIRAGVSPTRDDNIDAVFRLIADGETTISTNQAIAYFSALNGPDNDWSQSEFESVLTRLSNGPDAPATTNTSPATSTSSTTSSTSTSSTTSSTSTSSTTSTASTTPATSTTSTTSTASTTPATSTTPTDSTTSTTSTTSTDSTTPTTSTTSTTSTASTTPSTSLGGNNSSTTKNAGFDRVAGANGQIERSELRAVVAAADRDRNNELSRSEFKALAYELGVPAKNNADINEIFGIIAKGESNKITIQQALAYFDQFKGADNKWSEAEFSKIVTRLSEGAPSVFSSLATNGVIKTAALAAQFTRVDTNKDGQLDKSEFEQLAANLGVDALKGAKFSAVAGNNNKISAAELLGYANGFGTTTNGVVTWSEAQFNAVVSDLTKKGG